MNHPTHCPLCQTQLVYFELNFVRKGAYATAYCPVQIDTPKPIHIHNYQGHFGCYYDYTNTAINVPKTFHYEYQYSNDTELPYPEHHLVVIDGYNFNIVCGYTNVRRYDIKDTNGDDWYRFVPAMLKPSIDIIEQFQNFEILNG